MLLQMTRLIKLLSTLITGVPFVPKMTTLVLKQTRMGIEPFLADVTFVGPAVKVSSVSMISEICKCSIGLTTYLTGIGLFFSVSSGVNLKLTWRQKAFVTQAALKII